MDRHLAWDNLKNRILLGSIAMMLILAGCGFTDTKEVQYRDDSVRVVEKRNETFDELWLEPPKVLESTITVQGSSDEVQLSRVCPFTIAVKEKSLGEVKERLLLKAGPYSKAGSDKSEFSWQYWWKFGVPGGKHDSSAVYRLPFSIGQKCHIFQGYSGKLSHFKGSQEEYAIDFGVPTGTIICAARGGIVVAVRSDSKEGGPDRHKFGGAANYVVIKHADGTYGTYMHLLFNSALVSCGEKVEAGAPLGGVGNTGFSTGHHLHFDVGVPIDGRKRITIPTNFQLAPGVVGAVKEGEHYTAS